MHQQLDIPAKQTGKSYKLPALIVAFIALSLSLTLIITNQSSHKKKSSYTSSTISLPEEASLDVDSDSELEKNEKHTDWTIVTTHQGDSLGVVFKRLGLSQQTLLSIINNNPYAKNLSGIKQNQQLQFLIRNGILEKLIIPLNPTQVLVIYRQDKQYISKVNSREMNSHNQYLTATVRGSFYGTAQRLNIPYKLIKQMTDIFNWEIDFSKDIRTGDQFSILYNAFYVDDKWVSTGDIIAVTYNNRGKLHQAIRHENAAGEFDYFTPQGVSLKKAFSRYPIKFSHISSTFSLSRQHPILHYSRPHKGVDLAAPIGTPILATGDGRIQVLGHQSDYGNMIKIDHNKTYSSVYGHLLRFQKGLSKGSTVKRGQVIGYVGQTGLATGPHCHYEFHVNSTPKNPTTIELPRASPISSREIASFKANANVLLARLKLFEDANLIGSADRKTVNTG